MHFSCDKSHYSTVARSSIEVEFRELAHDTVEIRWIGFLICELHIILSYAPTLWRDNLGATYLTANPVFHQCTKHTEIDLHFIRDMILSQMLFVQYVQNVVQLADDLAKGHNCSFFLSYAKLHIASNVHLLWGNVRVIN